MKRRREDSSVQDEFDQLSPSLSICPVCGSSVTKENIGLHVEQHFTQPEPSTSSAGLYHDVEVPNFSDTADFRICPYGECQAIVSSTEWDDHMFSHTFENQPLFSSLTTDISAELHQQEQRSATAALYTHTDQTLLQELEPQELENLDNQPSLWEDELLAHALQTEEQQGLDKAKRKKEEEEFRKLQAMYGMNTSGGYASQYSRSLEKDVSKQKASVGDYYARKAEMLKILMTDSDSGESCTRGIISKLHHRYKLGVTGTKSVWLALDTDHYASTVGDAGWGCGYRNFQMLLSALLRDDNYKPLLLSVGDSVPSIPKLQQLIESAWNNGFDRQGAEQLACKLVNTRKWIGATEIASSLRSLGARVKLIDFHRATGCDGTHPEMFSWIKGYFNSPFPGVGVSMGVAGVLRQTARPPLYLQHQGHSRLVVGVEEHGSKDGGLYLLLFDPSHSAKQMHALSNDIQSSSSALRHLRRSLKQMRCKQYQIVCAEGVMDSIEMEQSKILGSLRIP